MPIVKAIDEDLFNWVVEVVGRTEPELAKEMQEEAVKLEDIPRLTIDGVDYFDMWVEVPDAKSNQ